VTSATPRQHTAIPLTRMRKAIARAMTASALIPQFTIESDATIRALTEFLRELNETDGAPSYSDCVIASCARALRQHTKLNATFSAEAILQYATINIGFAVALEDGLIAPAIRNADRLDLDALAKERIRLSEGARAGTLTGEDILSTTFTVTNLGPLGVRRFRALVVPPQAAILAVGAVTSDGMMSLSLSCDHRVVDGAPAAEFLGDIIDFLERPKWMEPLRK
jgi:pyruvate dehydrogenase E2 component (dihydrolipoamide acetyltransferase)